MLILHIQEEVEMEVTEVGMVVIEGEGEEEEALEEIEEGMVVIEEIEVTEAMVKAKKEMRENMEDGMVKTKTGKMSRPILLNSTTISVTTNQFSKSLKSKSILNQLMKEPAQHILEIPIKFKSQSCTMKGKSIMKTRLIKKPHLTT